MGKGSLKDMSGRGGHPNAWGTVVTPRGYWTCAAGAFAVGFLAAAPVVMPQSAIDLERAARLVEDLRSESAEFSLAQGADKGFAVGSISGPADVPIPISVRIPKIEGGVYNFLVFRNLPKSLKISAGFPVDDQWVVPLEQAGSLSVMAPEDYRGSFEMVVKLRIGGTDNSETLTVPVTIFAPGEDQRSVEAAGAKSGEAKKLSEDVETAMLQRAEAMLETRDVSGARMIYQYLVQLGSSKAAYGMARTYDPTHVKEIGVAGMHAEDIDQAKKWYQHAALLGHKEAQQRLNVMAAGTR